MGSTLTQAVADTNRAAGQFSITVTLPAIPLLVPDQALAVINKLTLQTMRLALQEVAGRVSAEAQKFADTGILAQSFGADPATEIGGIELTGVDTEASISGRVFSSLPYAIVMEEGRRPGAPISRAGVDAIGLWAQRKLGLTPDDAARAKWAISFAIIRRGIPAKHFAAAGWEAAQPGINGLFDALATAVADGLTS